MPSRADKILFTTSILAGILAVLATDFGLSKYKKISNRNTKLLTFDEYNYYEPKPNTRESLKFGTYKYLATTDKQGFRAPDSLESAKALQGCPPIYFIGDSFTWGSGLNWASTYPGLFSKVYNGSIFNMGVESHSPTPYLHRLKKLTRSYYRPSNNYIVVLAIDISDVQDEASFWKDSKHATPQMRQRSISEIGFQRWLTEKFPLTYQAYLHVKNLQIKKILTPKKIAQINTHKSQLKTNSLPLISAGHDMDRSAFTWRPWEELADSYSPLGVQGGLERIKEKTSLMSELIKQSGGHLFLLEYPWPAQLSKPQSELNWPKFVKALCEINDCAGVISTTPLFQKISQLKPKWYEEYYFNGDSHFNENGYSLIADAIQGKLKQHSASECFN